jgi:hypothetical protein
LRKLKVITMYWSQSLKLSGVQEERKKELKHSIIKIKLVNSSSRKQLQTTSLSSIFDTKDDLNVATKHFIKRLNGYIHQSFKKIRISEKSNDEISQLFEKRRHLRNKDDKESKDELARVEEELANKCAKDNYEKIMEDIKDIDCEEGGVHSGRLWNLKRKLCPRSRDPPTAKLDSSGNLLTSSTAIQKRLENRKIKEDLKDIQKLKEDLCQQRIEFAEKN